MNTWIDTALFLALLLILCLALGAALNLVSNRRRRDAWKHSKIDEIPYRSKW